MKMSHFKIDYEVNHIIDQLNELGFYETEGKSQKELIDILARIKAMEIKADRPGMGWF